MLIATPNAYLDLSSSPQQTPNKPNGALNVGESKDIIAAGPSLPIWDGLNLLLDSGPATDATDEIDGLRQDEVNVRPTRGQNNGDEKGFTAWYRSMLWIFDNVHDSTLELDKINSQHGQNQYRSTKSYSFIVKKERHLNLWVFCIQRIFTTTARLHK